MIAVDTSALMAIVLEEPSADACEDALADAGRLLISAVTLAEARVVAARRGFASEMQALIEGLAFDVIPATATTARRVAAIYDRLGKGVHPARLNFADCFAYDVAQQHRCPLLFVGEDFARTDVIAALTA